MNFLKKLFLTLFLFAFVFKAVAQYKGKLISLKNVLTSIEKQHKITFNYLENDIKSVKIIAPKKNLPLNQKISYLESNTGLIFEIIDSKFISIYIDKKQFKICGYIYSKLDNVALVNANILFKNGDKTTTNSNGFFEIKLENACDFSLTHVGFETKAVPSNEVKSKICNNYYLDYKINKINEIIAGNYLTSGVIKSIDGSYLIKPKKFGILPGLIEPDVLHTMLELPGIYSTDESVSSINVRSGTHDQNLFLWNGIKMYQTGHFFGLISAFNPFLSHSIKIYKNGSSAFYGDGVSSVVDISTNPELIDKNKFSFGVNMLNADVYGKINISKTGFIELSGRKSLTDIIKTATYKEYFKRAFQNTTILDYSNNESVNYINDENFEFYDISLKYFQKIGQKNQIIFDLITIDDQLDISQKNSVFNPTYSKENTLYQKNFGGSFTLKTDWNKKNTSSLVIANSQYELDAKNKNLLNGDSKTQENKINDSSIKLDNYYKINSKFNFNSGYHFNTINIKNIEQNNNPIIHNTTEDIINEHSLIAEGKYNDTINNIRISSGIRTNYIEQFQKLLFEPRFQFNYDITSYLNINLLGEFKNQKAFQIIEYRNDYFGIEKRRWMLSNESTIPIQKSKQISFSINLKKNDWNVTVETFYKNVSGITSASQGFQNQYEFTRTIGDYFAKGIEFYLQKKINHFLTWITYNVSDSKYNFSEIPISSFTNNFEIDHIFSWAGIYEKNHFKLALGTRWHSGKPETNPSSTEINYSNPENPYIEFNTPNNQYLESFFQVDGSASYKWTTSKNIQYKFGISVLNILNRKNEISEYYRINNTFNSIEEIKTFSIERTPNFSFRIIF